MSQNGVENLLRLVPVDRTPVQIDATDGSQEPGRFDDLLRQVDTRQTRRPAAHATRRPRSAEKPPRAEDPPTADSHVAARDDRPGTNTASRPTEGDAPDSSTVDDRPVDPAGGKVDRGHAEKKKDKGATQEDVTATVSAAAPKVPSNTAEGQQAARKIKGTAEEVKAELPVGRQGPAQGDQAAGDQAAGDQAAGDTGSAGSKPTPASGTHASVTANRSDPSSEKAVGEAASSGPAEGTANPRVETAHQGEAAGKATDRATAPTGDGTTDQPQPDPTGEAGPTQAISGNAAGSGSAAADVSGAEKEAGSGDRRSGRQRHRSPSAADPSPRVPASSGAANTQSTATGSADGNVSQGGQDGKEPPPQFAAVQPAPLGSDATKADAPDSRNGSSPARSTRSPVPAVGTTSRSEAMRLQARVPGNAAPDAAAGNIDHVRFVQRVARALEMARSQGGDLHLRLSPPELGRLHLEVSVKHGILSARLEAETHAARSLLLDNLPALRDRLAEQHIRIERFHVDLMPSSSDGSQGQVDYRDASGQGQPGRLPGGRARRVDHQDEPRPTAQRSLPHIDGNLNVIV